VDGFLASAGVVQSCLLPPRVFNLFPKAALSFAKTTDGTSIGEELIDSLAYADASNKIGSYGHLLQAETNKLVTATKAFGMVINTAKTKVMDCASRAMQLTMKENK